MTPLVSVLMTAYNREQYIAEAIESVLASTYINFELIILDDGSIDDTVAIAKSFEKKDSRIIVYKNEVNLGQFPNRNKIASYATGKYLKYLDSDDKILDFGLAYCVEQMEKFPNAGLGMYCANGIEKNRSECWPPEKIIREHFFSGHQLSIGPTGTIIRRDKFLETGGFDTRFGVPSDMYFNIRFASFSPIVLMPMSFVYYRRHDGQEINNSMDYLKFGYLYLKELLENIKLPLEPKEINYLHRKMKKRHAVNIVKYFLNTKSIPATKQVMDETKFTLGEVATSMLY
jgi:glycosyltransferase involved in cell wall biosynthesis